MQKRKFDELVSYFNKKVSEMEIETKYKMELLGMVTALGYAHEKETHDKRTETHGVCLDTISRQAAIDAMCNACSDWCDEGVCKKVSAIQKLPSAQPEVRTQMSSADCISRQAAIDAVRIFYADECALVDSIEEVLNQLPSAQQEITLEDIKKYCEKRCLVILTSELYHEMASRWSSAQPERVYCKDCKYFDTVECMGRNAFYGLKDDDYCSWAERKEEHD